ncbi:MAG: hypothetical protein WA691_06080 [Thermoplasmata archaeon]
MGGYATPRLPLGVAVLAVLTGIFGAIVLLAGLVVVLVALLVLASAGYAATFGVGAIAGLILFTVGAIILAIAFGLWDQELWAFVLALIATGAAVVWFIVLPLLGGGGLASILTLPGIFSGVLFVYLLAVQDAFW